MSTHAHVHACAHVQTCARIHRQTHTCTHTETHAGTRVQAGGGRRAVTYVLRNRPVPAAPAPGRGTCPSPRKPGLGGEGQRECPRPRVPGTPAVPEPRAAETPARAPPRRSPWRLLAPALAQGGGGEAWGRTTGAKALFCLTAEIMLTGEKEKTPAGVEAPAPAGRLMEDVPSGGLEGMTGAGGVGRLRARPGTVAPGPGAGLRWDGGGGRAGGTHWRRASWRWSR